MNWHPRRIRNSSQCTRCGLSNPSTRSYIIIQIEEDCPIYTINKGAFQYSRYPFYSPQSQFLLVTPPNPAPGQYLLPIPLHGNSALLYSSALDPDGVQCAED